MKGNHIFDTNYGRSSLTDPVTGTSLAWNNGSFEAARTMSFPKRLPSSEKERLRKEMEAYARENFPDLI